MKRELKVGDVLIAKNKCKMLNTNEYALTFGKEYPIEKVDFTKKEFTIKSNIFECHEFDFSDIDIYFTIKQKQKESVKAEAKNVDDIQVGDEYVGKSNGRDYSIIAMSIKDDFYRLKINGEDYFFNHTKRSLDKNFTKKAKAPTEKDIASTRYEGTIIPLSNSDSFYMVIIEGCALIPKIKHESYDLAFQEALRLSKKENKTTYVVQAISQVEQVVNVKQLKIN